MDRDLGPKGIHDMAEDGLGPLPEARMTDLVRLTIIPVFLSSSGAATKLPTMSVAAFLRSPWANSLQASA